MLCVKSIVVVEGVTAGFAVASAPAVVSTSWRIDSSWLSFETEQEIPDAGAVGIGTEPVHAAGVVASAGAASRPPANTSAPKTVSNASTGFHALITHDRTRSRHFHKPPGRYLLGRSSPNWRTVRQMHA